uniref:Uncharacterized protein n=1 Tax=Capra hircus TaxID=9925 RepID=A0A8C2QUR2_CAPHI
MSSRESPAVEFSTTTVSSVAVQAGDSKIVIAVIKCGKWVQLQLAESQPNLLEIGSNQDETKKLLHDHELLLAKLKVCFLILIYLLTLRLLIVFNLEEQLPFN